MDSLRRFLQRRSWSPARGPQCEAASSPPRPPHRASSARSCRHTCGNKKTAKASDMHKKEFSALPTLHCAPVSALTPAHLQCERQVPVCQLEFLPFVPSAMALCHVPPACSSQQTYREESHRLSDRGLFGRLHLPGNAVLHARTSKHTRAGTRAH